MTQTSVAKWIDLLERADKAQGMEDWKTRCRVIKRKYLYENSMNSRARRYQLLWSNIQQLQSAIYSKPPHGVVKRRYTDPDPVARIATEILERAVNFSLDSGCFHTTFKHVRDDFLLYARGPAPLAKSVSAFGPDYRALNNPQNA